MLCKHFGLACFTEWNSGDSSRYVLIVHFSLLLSSILWYRCTTICLTIRPLKDIWDASSFWLLQMKLLWTVIYRFLCEWESAFSSDKCLGMQLLYCMVFAYLLCKLPNCFLEQMYHFYILIINIWVIHFLCILASICYCP